MVRNLRNVRFYPKFLMMGFLEILPDTPFGTDFYCNFKHDFSKILHKKDQLDKKFLINFFYKKSKF